MMDAITALTTRVSEARLTEPAPTEAQLTLIRQAALRAADHGNLRPWRFLEVTGDGLNRLGALYVAASQQVEAVSEPQAKRLQGLPMRAPMVIVAIARLTEHPKVPMDEQRIAAGCAVQNMLNAAFAMGLGAYWRTGALAENPYVCKGLGLSESEAIVGFLYLGQVAGEAKACPELDAQDYFKVWP
ncbi:nitroreductase family protein [Simiduia sp. 21SJ11W-1]|uniref:nitroreductase family protein n=1 Tax=Simiduia sp. 21SJ11W-1 TaxID=2909669 RepID=UPI0020A0B8F9|nr:nitroreductase family protein [Simiduia sp. 21SJ11W-1]UTA46552.1 nitroreductase family protein [Simiduia sp. 21SJ11W-1]